jgi:hypothetical protein
MIVVRVYQKEGRMLTMSSRTFPARDCRDVHVRARATQVLSTLMAPTLDEQRQRLISLKHRCQTRKERYHNLANGLHSTTPIPGRTQPTTYISLTLIFLFSTLTWVVLPNRLQVLSPRRTETAISMAQAVNLSTDSSTSLDTTRDTSPGSATARYHGRCKEVVWQQTKKLKFLRDLYRKNPWYVRIIFGLDSRAKFGSKYLLLNLGMSENFGTVDLEHIQFPAKMTVDYIRVYQDPDNVNIGCDPRK